jgi:hypothetical protein
MPIRWTTEAPKPVSQAEDVARSSGTGLIEGLASTFGTPGDMLSMAGSAVRWGADKLGGKGADFKFPGAPLPIEALRQATVKGLQSSGVDPRIAKLATTMMPGGLSQAPTSQDLVGVATKDGKPLYQPQTRAGRYARTAASFAPAAVMPGSAAQRIVRVAAPGIASEAAGEATRGTKLEPYARVAAALVAGGLGEAATRPTPQTRILADASRGASEAQIATARRLMDDAAQRGIRLTMAEALQQATDSGTGMGRLQRVIEQTEGGGARIAPVMAERPAQVAAAVRGYADDIAPPPADPYTAASGAQDAARGTLTDVRQAINANARPWYDALQTERMPPTPAAQQVMTSEPYRQALAAVRGDPILNAQIAALPDDSLAVVNEVTKQLDTLADNARPNPAISTGNAQLSAAYEAARNQVDELAGAYSEPWRLARGMVASQREQFLEPIQNGPLGSIAQTSDPKGQISALFPNAPVEGAAGPTNQAIQMLPQDVGRGLVRQQLMTGFNEAAQDLSTGPNQWGGAGWAAKQFGNPEQSATLMAGVDAAGGDAGDLQRLVEVLRATGKRQAPGSMTAYNARDLERLGDAGALGEVARTGLNPPGAFRRIGTALQNWQTERNAGRLADAILADPAQAEAILLHARQVVPPGADLQAIERLALSAQLARQPAIEGR